MEKQTLIDGTTRDKYTTKETAEFVRQALRAAFPTVKFSVTTKYASMTSSTNVRWTDGPTEDQVELVTGRFTSRGFDGMTDSTTFHEQELNGRRVSFSGWICLSRHTSESLRARAAALAAVRGCEIWPILHKLNGAGMLVTVKRSIN